MAVDKRTRKRYAMKSISKRKAESDPNFRKDIRTEVGIGVVGCMGHAAVQPKHGGIVQTAVQRTDAFRNKGARTHAHAPRAG